MKNALWVKVYGPGWDQCVKADSLDWSSDSLSGKLDGEQVLFVHLMSVDAIFVTPDGGEKKKPAEEKS